MDRLTWWEHRLYVEEMNREFAPPEEEEDVEYFDDAGAFGLDMGTLS